MNKAKSRQSRKKEGRYKDQFFRTERNKKRRAEARSKKFARLAAKRTAALPSVR